MLCSGTTTSTGVPSGYRRLSRMRSAVRWAIARVWASSDSRTPCCRPSTAGRIPIRGHSPTNRPEGLIVAMWFLSREALVAGRWRPAWRAVSGRRGEADRQQDVRVQPLVPGRDREGDVAAARGLVERMATEALELDALEQPPEVDEDRRLAPVVGAHHAGTLDRDRADEGTQHVRDTDHAGG